MKIVVIGATGTIGKAVADRLAARHDVVRVARRGPVAADLEDAASIQRLFDAVRDVDAVVSCAGSAAFKPFAQLTEADLELGLRSKLMGQVHLARVAAARLRSARQCRARAVPAPCRDGAAAPRRAPPVSAAGSGRRRGTPPG